MNTARETPQQRLERQQDALLALSRRWRWYEADLEKAAAAITETAAVAITVERAGVWFHDAERDSLICYDLYEATPRRHTRGTELRAADYPDYFKSLHDEEVLAAADAHTDPRTAAFSAEYFTPLGIGATLDAPIRVGRRVIGVLCLEHVGGKRHFTTDEQNTASYLANMVSVACAFQRRAESELEAARALSLLRAAFEASGTAVLAVDLDGKVTAHNKRFVELFKVDDNLIDKPGKRSERIAYIAAQTVDPTGTAARISAIYDDPDNESRDLFEMKDGRALDCISQPQRLDGVVIGRVWSFRDITRQHQLEQELRELAIRDVLTGLCNRRRAEELLEHEIERAGRSGQPLSVAMLDIDHFKAVNDTHGHQTGDDVLRQLGKDLNTRLRKTDVACRWGGEEFLLVLPHTDRAGALKVVDELRRYVARERKDLPTFTISAGVAEYDGDKRYDATVALADKRLYEAKQAGRNRVI